MPRVAAFRTAAVTLAATAILAATPALANGPMGGSMGGSPPVNTSSAASTPQTGGTPGIMTGTPIGGFPRLGMPPVGRQAPAADIPVMRAAPETVPVMRADTGIAAARSARWQQMNQLVDNGRNGSIGTAIVSIVTRNPIAAQAATGADGLLAAAGGLASVPPITVKPAVPPVSLVATPTPARPPVRGQLPAAAPVPLLPAQAGPVAQISPSELVGKTPAQIHARAQQLGLVPMGPNPAYGRGAYVDPQTGVQRILSHPHVDANPHGHVNTPAGARIDAVGNIVPPESDAAHLPIFRN